MPLIDIKVDGIAKLQRMLTRADGSVYNNSKETVRGATTQVTMRARALCPVGETGRLQKSIGMMMMKAVGFVGIKGDDGRWSSPTSGGGRAMVTPRVYWRYVEFGTVRQPAQPFFRPAAESSKGPFAYDMMAMGPKIESDI